MSNSCVFLPTSGGPSPGAPADRHLLESSLKFGAAFGRNKTGTIYVMANGNYGIQWTSQLNGLVTRPYTISVQAVEFFWHMSQFFLPAWQQRAGQRFQQRFKLLRRSDDNGPARRKWLRGDRFQLEIWGDLHGRADGLRRGRPDAGSQSIPDGGTCSLSCCRRQSEMTRTRSGRIGSAMPWEVLQPVVWVRPCGC